MTGSSSGSSSGTFDPNNFGSSSSSGSSGGSGSSAPSAFGSSSGGGAQSQTGSQPQSQTGSQHQSQSGSTGSSFGGASQTGGATGGNAGTFDPIKANSMATSGFNPLNPMLGKRNFQLSHGFETVTFYSVLIPSYFLMQLNLSRSCLGLRTDKSILLDSNFVFHRQEFSRNQSIISCTRDN